ncbi:NCS2 family permease [Anaerosporobacter faecicola]|uniref:NCS2 family permease n=1 Tax=Anaerosporobacter faecicola TaxID=2718714 RepID=UPI00143AA55B|nr:NCS2 family permease [Anaerosporobacter faecicola]
MLERLFKLKQNQTTVKTEVLAGITTFVTMAYILAVNPLYLSQAGMNANAVLMATALASFIGTMLMALLANYPFALAPGMGLNTYFAFTVCGVMGFSWQVALLAVLVEGVIFIVLSLTNVREAIFNAIPTTLKHAVSAGIGLFIAFIGLQGSKLVVSNGGTLVTYQNFKEKFTVDGICAVLALIGVIITAILLVKKVRGAILIGILATWILGMICQAIGLYEGMSLYPDFSNGLHLDALGKTFGQAFHFDRDSIKIIDFIVVVFAFLFVDLFDTLGTLIGVASKSNMLDKEGKLPRIKGALLADSLATCAGAILGTSTTTTYVESSSGVSEGGRTGLTAFTTAILFLLSMFLSPIFVAIPSFATAPALIIVGFYMISAVTKINFDDMTEAIPAFLCIIAMPFMYSIAEGIALGVISYTLINVISGKAKEKKISLLMYVLTVLFIAKYVVMAVL